MTSYSAVDVVDGTLAVVSPVVEPVARSFWLAQPAQKRIALQKADGPAQFTCGK